MLKKTSSKQSYGRDRECKIVRFKVPQYIKALGLVVSDKKNLCYPLCKPMFNVIPGADPF